MWIFYIYVDGERSTQVDQILAISNWKQHYLSLLLLLYIIYFLYIFVVSYLLFIYGSRPEDALVSHGVILHVVIKVCYYFIVLNSVFAGIGLLYKYYHNCCLTDCKMQMLVI